MRQRLLCYVHPDRRMSLISHDGRGRVEAIRDYSASESPTPLSNLLPILWATPDILLTRARVPARNRRQLEQALPFALEDQLASDLDELYCLAGNKEADECPAAVVARASLDHCLQTLGERGVHPTRLWPAMLALPLPPGGWSLLRDDEWILARTGPQAGFCVESDNLGTFLSLALTECEENPPSEIRLLLAPEEPPLLNESQTQGVPLRREVHPRGAAGWLAQGMGSADAPPAGLNLLRGARAGGDQFSGWWRPWRLSAALIGIWLGIQAVGMSREVIELRQQRRRLNEQVENIYRATFPDAGQISNPQVQMERRLAALSQGPQAGPDLNEFLPLLQTVTQALRDLPEIFIKRLEYRNGYLDLELQLPDLQRWEELRRNLLARDLEVDMRYTDSHRKGVDTRLRIQARRP